MSSTCSSEVLLCTARVKVTNPATNETMIVRALLDSGSQLTIITEAVKRHLNLIPQPSDTTILADPTLNEPSPVNMLIGADLFWDIISAQQHSLGHGFPKLQASKFGWLVTGPLPCFNQNKTESVMCNFVSKDTSSNIHDDLSKFWELENFPQKSPSSEEKFPERARKTAFLSTADSDKEATEIFENFNKI
ncbi:hypothetical protein SFRURICE_004908 [Spodoptera frugiperda]|nr:hypothetical protein SFRURICE_004908 [Spodoptera frugiperda]